MSAHRTTKPARKNPYIIPNLDRALRVMEHLSTRQEGGSITEIANQLSLPKNSVFRILRTLAASGYLDEHDKVYRLSPKILSLGYAAVQSTHLIDACMDEMRTLRDEINETIFVGALSEGTVVILEQLPSFQLVKFTIEIGHKVPIHASAPGKAILAYLPPAEQKDLLNHIAFTRFNDRTIPGMKAMLKEIEKIQAVGYALDLGEEVVELCCAAAPILDYRAYPIASVWLSGPEFRLSKMDLPKVGAVVREHALRISKQFGYDPTVARGTAFKPLEPLAGAAPG
jgi:DNA-binding IclR family transcriptional regulator